MCTLIRLKACGKHMAIDMIAQHTGRHDQVAEHQITISWLGILCLKVQSS